MIPNHFHFVFGLAPDFGGKPFSLVHYLAIRSAVVTNQPEKIYFHYQYEPAGEWWERARPYLHLNPIVAPREIFGNPLRHVAHQCDVVRLRALQEWGGVYLDLDVLCKKSFEPLRRHYPCVIGAQYDVANAYLTPIQYARKIVRRLWTGQGHTALRAGLCNAVLLAEPGSQFIQLWLDRYRTFRSTGRDAFWGEHSGQISLMLARQHPRLVKILNGRAFHYPLYDPRGLAMLFEQDHAFRDAYAHHLWESYSWTNYLEPLSPELIQTRDTTFHRLARPLLTP